MKKLIKKILKEETYTFGEDDLNYERCSKFNKGSDEYVLCYNLYKMGSFLYRDLGLKDIINQKLSLMGEIQDLNDRYQKPLELLIKTRKYPNIKQENNYFYLDRLSKVNTVYNIDGEWDYINKLNTNYADLAELLTELFIRGKMVDNLVSKNSLELKNYLLSIKNKLLGVLDKYFMLDEYKEFVRNTKNLSKKGEKAEEDVYKVLEKFGMTLLYRGGNGDFIDMIFGIDLIMGYKNKIYTIQVKNTEEQVIKAQKEDRYKKIDYFVSPTSYGVIIYNNQGVKTKLNFDGGVI